MRPPSIRPPSIRPAAGQPPALELVRQSREKRSRRVRQQRATTLHPRQLRSWYRRRLPMVYPKDVTRPTQRADCANAVRPCPWVSCKYHLYLDVKPNGAIKLNFPDLEPHEMRVSCALDVAAHGGLATELVSQAMNLTRERARQVEVAIMQKLRAAAEAGNHPATALLEHAEEDAA